MTSRLVMTCTDVGENTGPDCVGAVYNGLRSEHYPDDVPGAEKELVLHMSS